MDNAVASSLSDAFGMTDHVSVWLPRPLGEGNALQRAVRAAPTLAAARTLAYTPRSRPV